MASSSPHPVLRTARAFVLGSAWALTLAALAGWVSASADSASWSAYVLAWEPALAVGLLWLAYAAAVQRWSALAIATLTGVVASLALLHRPEPAHRPGLPPMWATEVQGCAQGLTPPKGRVRVLQWTLEGVSDGASVLGLVQQVEPDITVLHGKIGRGLGDGLTEALGGEFVVKEAEGDDDGRIVHTRGAFHRCGDASDWSDAVDGPYGATLLFVGIDAQTAFPLVVGRLPPLGASLADWARENERARDRLSGLADLLGAPGTIAVADASATWGHRRLDGTMAGAGLGAVRVPPSGPLAWGNVPLLPLHPWDRMWAGAGWRVVRSDRLPVPEGARGAILTELGPAR